MLTALRTQQLIAEESGACETIDPLGGSYFVEKMTDQIEARALELMSRIEEMGGMTKAIESRFPQKEIERSAYAYQSAVEKGDIVVVGVNKYRGGDSLQPAAFTINPEIERHYREKLGRLRSERDDGKVEQLLSALEKTARGTANLLPPIIEAVKGDCTLGEISSTLEKVFGRYEPGTTM